jgi:hypothetical protein
MSVLASFLYVLARNDRVPCRRRQRFSQVREDFHQSALETLLRS